MSPLIGSSDDARKFERFNLRDHFYVIGAPTPVISNANLKHHDPVSSLEAYPSSHIESPGTSSRVRLKPCPSAKGHLTPDPTEIFF